MGTHGQLMRLRKRQVPQLRITALLAFLALLTAISSAIGPTSPTAQAAARTWTVTYGMTIHEVWPGKG